jgi:hypothetical protein
VFIKVSTKDNRKQVAACHWRQAEVTPVLREVSWEKREFYTTTGGGWRKFLRIPNHSMHTVGNNEKTLPWARPNKVLATHRFSIRSSFAAATCEIKKKNETRTSE